MNPVIDSGRAADDVAGDAIVVYSRPGCGFCSSLRRQLDHHDVPHRLVDIWSDPAGAAFVRSVARGHETVPTVSIGSIVLVNPSIHELLATARVHAPQAVPADYVAPTPGRLGSMVNRLLGG